MKLLLFDITIYDDEEQMKRWGVLYSEFNTKNSAIIYYVAFLLRRLILSISFILLKDYPMAQIITCSISCVMVICTQFFLYITIVRPFKNRVQNIISILNEYAVALGYSSYILFIVNFVIDHIKTGWIILGCIGGTFTIQNLYIIYSIISKISAKIYNCYSSVRRNIPETTGVTN